MDKDKGTLIACYFTQWSIDNNKPGIIYCCHNSDEVEACKKKMEGDALLMKELKRARPEDICCWCNSLHELGYRYER